MFVLVLLANILTNHLLSMVCNTKNVFISMHSGLVIFFLYIWQYIWY